MPEETTTIEAPVTTEGSEPVVAPDPSRGMDTPTPTPEPAPVATTPSWQEELEKADAKALRSHPKIAGIIGSEIQRAIQSEKQRIQAEEGVRAARETEARLRKLAQEDPVTFAEEYLTVQQRQDMQKQLDDLRGNARAEIATAVGRAYTDVPEWQELTDADHEALARAVMGKSDDEVIPIFHREALNLVADKRAKTIHERWKKEALAKEREVIRAEEAAKLLKDSEAPDTTKPKGLPAKFNPASLEGKDFDDWWEKGKL